MKTRKIVAAWTTFLILAIWSMASLAAGSGVKDVTVEQAKQLIQERGGKPDFVVLDVRTPGEFAEGRLPGAVNVDIQAPDFGNRLGALDRGKGYLVYCRTGNRSMKAVQVMQRLGFRSVYHMAEGILRWQKMGFPMTRVS